jgi:hypothetical protein
MRNRRPLAILLHGIARRGRQTFGIKAKICRTMRPPSSIKPMRALLPRACSMMDKPPAFSFYPDPGTKQAPPVRAAPVKMGSCIAAHLYIVVFFASPRGELSQHPGGMNGIAWRFHSPTGTTGILNSSQTPAPPTPPHRQRAPSPPARPCRARSQAGYPAPAAALCARAPARC